jgi:hypothetical protein
MYRDKIELEQDLEEAKAAAGKLSYTNNRRRLQSAIRPGACGALTGAKGANSGLNVGVSYADHIASKYKGGRGVSAHGASEANIKGIRNVSRGGQRLSSAVADSSAGARRRTA